MGIRQQKNFFSLPTFLKKLFFQNKQVEQVHTKNKKPLDPVKQKKLEKLCEQLFKRKDLITSGKLQFIGLSKIKKRMGKDWTGLSQIVYETVEDVIDSYLDKGDIFIRYKDDTYIIVFAHAAPEESRLKSMQIAEEVRRRLFELNEEDLRDIEILQAVSEISASMMEEADFLDDMFGAMDNTFGDLEDELDWAEPDDEAVSGPEPPPEIQETQVDAQNYPPQKKSAQLPVVELSDLKYSYMPLWDTKRGALTTYLCLAGDPSTDTNLFKTHKDLYNGETVTKQAALDCAFLKIVTKELQAMENDERKFFVICPVQHGTVYNMGTYEPYKKLLSQIPNHHRKYLLLLVMDMDRSNPPKNAYWFAKPLRVLLPHIFAEVPLRRDINFKYLHESGVNVAGVKLDNDKMTEQEIMTILSNLSTKAKALRIPKTFVLNVTTLSLTTSAVCAGFDYLGGSAIHPVVAKPDNVHRYKHADLIKDLVRR